MNRIRRDLLRRAEKLRRRIALYESYLQGDLAQLGVRAETPCIRVADAKLRRPLLRAVVLANLPPRPGRAHICHRCDDRTCISADHLFWGTVRDNVRDCVVKGRRRGGRSLEQLRDDLADVAAQLSAAELLIQRRST